MFPFSLVTKLIVVCATLASLPFWAFSVFFTYPIDARDNFEQNGFRVGMVLGASVLVNGRPSFVLQQRLNKAVELFRSGQIDLILVSGDNQTAEYNEPQAMRNYLLEQSIPTGAILQDFGGSRTIDSCWRAKNVFGIEKLVIISQSFHLARGAFLCHQVGIKVEVAQAENASNYVLVYGLIRELPASWLAVWEGLSSYEAPKRDNGEVTNEN